jgi:C4-dicarboxylate transporter DctM subunit
MIIMVFVALLVLMLLGVPVAFAILIPCSAYISITEIKPLLLVGQRMTTGIDSFPLLAVPLFILVGNLMEIGGISRRLIDWARSVFGGFPGGMGDAVIIACAIFAALTGSGPATVAAIGTVSIPIMAQEGYAKRDATGIVAAAGALGPIIPPSIIMIVYGVCMSLSVPAMFVGGIMPGLFIALMLIVLNTIKALRSPAIMAHRTETMFSFMEVLKNTYRASSALLMPVIILGGIYSGVFTPTEAAAVGVVYALVVGMFIFKELKWKNIWAILESSMLTSAMVAIIMSSASILSWLISMEEVGTAIVNYMLTIVDSPVVYLLVLNMILFVVGCLLDTTAATLILAPLLVPVGIALGINPLHLGLVFVINLVIGMVTPPFGYNLFMAVSITKLPFNEVVKGTMPYLLLIMACVLVIAFCPFMTTWLPGLLGFRI